MNTKKFRFIKQKFGFSLVEVMVAAGLMSVVGLAITSVISNSTKSQKRMEHKDSQTGAAAYIRSVLQNQGMCRNAFCTGATTCTAAQASALALPVVAGAFGPVNLQGIQALGTGLPVATVGQNILSCTGADCNNLLVEPAVAGPWGTPIPGTTGMYVFKLRLTNITYQGLVGANHSSTGFLEVQFASDPKKTSGGKFQTTQIPIVFTASGAGTIIGCTAGVVDSLWSSSPFVTANIFYNTGLVGIGTNNPARLLEVSGTDATSVIRLTSTTAGARAWELQASGVTSGTFGIFNATDAPGAPRMSITPAGNVGIGTNTPTARLMISSTGGDGVAIVDTTSPYMHLRRDAANEWFMVAAAVGANRLEYRPGNIGNPSVLTLTTAGATSVSGTLTSASALTVSAGGADITGNSRVVGGTFSVSGGLTSLNNSAAVAGTLGVTGGLSSFNNGASITGAFNVVGNTAITGAVGLTGATTVNGALTIVAAGGNTLTTPSITGAYTHIGGDLTGGGAGFRIINYGAYVTTSDRRYKKNLKELDWQTDLINQIMTYTYNYVEDKEGSVHHGVIAQELQKIYPDMVVKGPDGYLNVNYPELIPVVIKGLQESNARISELEKRIQVLEAKLEEQFLKIEEKNKF